MPHPAIRILLMLLIGILAACAPQEEQLPTPTATETIIPSTATAPPDRTPTATLLPGIRSLPTQGAAQPTPSSEPDPITGNVQFVHGIPSIGDVTFRTAEQELANSLPYSRYTLPIALPQGEHTVEAILSDGDGTPIVTQPITINEGQSTLMVLTGTPEAPRLITIDEDITPVEGNMSRIIVFNGVDTDIPIVVQSNGEALTSALPFTATSSAFTIPSETIMMTVVEGTTNRVAFEETYRPRELNTILLLPDPEIPSSVLVVTITKQLTGLGTVRAISVTESDYYDIYLNDTLLGTELGANISTDIHTQQTGEYVAAVYPAGIVPSTTQPSLTANVTISANQHTTLILSGAGETLRLTPVIEDHTLTEPDRGRIVFAHTVPDFARVNINDSQTTKPLFYGQATDPLSLTDGPYTFFWTDYAAAENILEQADNFMIEAGYAYLYIFSNRPQGNPLVLITEIGSEASEEASTGDAELVQPEEPVVDTVGLRAVNAAPDSEVEFRLDDTPIAEAQGYTDASEPYRLEAGQHVLTVHDANSGTLLARELFTFEENGVYSAYTYRSPSQEFRLLIYLDEQRDLAQAPIIRLVNLSNDEIFLGLSAQDSNQATPPNGILEVQRTNEERRSMPFGLTEISDGTSPGFATFWQVVVQLQNPTDLHITQPPTGEIMATLQNVQLEPRFYEVVAFYSSVTETTSAFLIPYPYQP